MGGDLDTDRDNDLGDLGAIIRDEIARTGPMTFARYMALALYHPTLGYYAGGGAGREPLGWSGDYFTSGDVSPLWGWALARQLRQMWELLGRPARFDVIEAGAGRGLLAREVWRFARFSAPEWGEALRYTLVDSALLTPDPSPGGRGESETRQTGETSQAGETCLAPTGASGSSLFDARRERLSADLARIDVPEERLRWIGSLTEASEDPTLKRASNDIESESAQADFVAARHSGANSFASPITGVIVSNELIDALPVHIVQVSDDDPPRLAEVYVDLDANGHLVERLDVPSSAAVAGYLDRFGIPWRAYGAGWRAEVCLAAEEWMREAAAALGRGCVITIDYGASARRLYTRDRRHGTLAVYARHQFGDRPLVAPGRHDITAHVNFSALARAGHDAGLSVAGYTTQAGFLRRLGVREAAEVLSKRLYPAAESERQTDRGQADLLRHRMLEGAVATLLDPRGLGGFRVLVQQRGVLDARRRLMGLSG